MSLKSRPIQPPTAADYEDLLFRVLEEINVAAEPREVEVMVGGVPTTAQFSAALNDLFEEAEQMLALGTQDRDDEESEA